MKTTTQETLDYYLKKFVSAARAVRIAKGSEPLRNARNGRAEAEVELIKAYNKHYPER